MRSYVELSFLVDRLSKPISKLAIILIQIVEKLQQFDSKVRITKYEAEIHKFNIGYEVKLSLVMKDILIFIK